MSASRAGQRLERMRVVALGAIAAIAGTVLLAASGWLVTRAAERPPVLALLAAIVVVRALGLVRAFGRYGERLAAHDLAFRQLAELRMRWYRRLVTGEPQSARAEPRSAHTVGASARAAPQSARAAPQSAQAAPQSARAKLRSALAAPGAAQSAPLPGSRAGGAALPAADLLSRFVVDVDELQHRDVRVRGPVVVAAVAAAAATGLAALILPLAALVLGGGLLVAGTLVPGLAYVSARTALRRQGAARAALVDEFVEAMDAAPQLALAGRGGERLGRIDNASAALARIGRRDAVAGALALALGTLAAGATLLGTLAVAIGPASDGRLEPVWLGALALLALGAFEAVAALPEAATRAVSVAAAERRLEEAVAPRERRGRQGEAPHSISPDAVLAARAVRHAPAGPGGAVVPHSISPDAVLAARAVRHAPAGPGGAVVLDGVDLDLAPGRRVAVIGASGAGKTVLVQLLAGLAQADGGTITLGAQPIDAFDPARVRAHVRLMGQGAHLFATSIANNVRIGAPDATDAQVDEALRASGLGDWLDALPDGSATLVGEEGFAISGGQRQRIALARCLVSPARLLLLDEPTAMLDPPASRAFLTDLATAAGDRGVLVITHERIGLDGFDAVHELRDGRLREWAGTPS
jgi:thiol reductant ABC exporter CydC subunit